MSYSRVLVANRGEIALRVMRTCREKGIETIAVHSRLDSDSLHVEHADVSCCIGDGEAADSYMNIPNIICAALQHGAEAVHPGYGFLSEDTRFAEICGAHGLSFIGPQPRALMLAGDKYRMREAADGVGVPVLPASSPALDVSSIREEAARVGYPLVIKPRKGGGGRGIVSVASGGELESALADRALRRSINKGGCFLEHCVSGARHIEVQLLADNMGNRGVAGLRDCSIQRRRQKVIEESPPRGISRRMNRLLHDAALRVCEASRFTTVGTVEFLLSGHDFYFLELNPRIQVEHTVTEMLTGIDLVWEQIRLSAGGRLTRDLKQEQCADSNEGRTQGHAIQVRVCAEPPEEPVCLSARVGAVWFPGGPGVRVDTHLYPGCSVPYVYDPLLAKIITWAPTRAQAVGRMRRALDEVRIDGVVTNLRLLKTVVDSEEFRKGHYHTNYLEGIEYSRQDEYGAAQSAPVAMQTCEANSI